LIAGGEAAASCTAIHIKKIAMLVESDFLPAVTGSYRHRHRIASMVPADRRVLHRFFKNLCEPTSTQRRLSG
jgi:hypothetical protein